MLVEYTLYYEKKRSIEAGERLTANVVAIYENYTASVLNIIDNALLEVRQRRRDDPRALDLRSFAKIAMPSSHISFQLSTMSRDGIIENSSVGVTTPGLSLSDREHYRVHRDGLLDGIFISKPVIGRNSGRWSIQITRALVTAEGTFDGVVVASLDPVHFSTLYGASDFGANGSFVLVGGDGVIRAHAPFHISTLGTPLSTDLDIAGFLQGDERARTGRDRSADGETIIASWRRVGHYPLVIRIGLAERHVLALYAKRALVLRGGTGAVIAIVALALFVAHRRGRRLMDTERTLSATDRTLKVKSEALETTLANMNQGLIMVDGKGVVVVINPQAVLLLGLPAEFLEGEVLFSEIVEWQSKSGEFADETRSIDPDLMEFIKGGGVATQSSGYHIYERTRANGITLEVRSVPLPDGGFVRTYTDITQRKEQEQKLQASATEIERFAHIASHDLQEPLRKIATYSKLLREALDDGDKGEVERCLATLIATAHRGRTLVSELLRYSRLKDKEVDRRASCLDAMVAEVVAEVPGEIGGEIIRIDNAVPRILVNCDVPLIQQVLRNLVENAVKYRKPGQGARIRLASEEDSVSREILLSITDDGIGFDPAHKEKMFQPFARLVTQSQVSGSGVGLSLVKSVLTKHGWPIEAHGEPGVGSTFTIRIPSGDVVIAEADGAREFEGVAA